MRTKMMLGGSLALAMVACSSEQAPTEPDAMAGVPTALAAAANSWSLRSARPSAPIYEIWAGVAPNAAGQSVVYVFGGHDGEGTGFGGSTYNVSTDTWGGGLPTIDAFAANGVGKIGKKLYFSGGYNDLDRPISFRNQLLAYDYAAKRLIERAPLPIRGAEGVTGVIGGKLYVLPGACGTSNPGQPGNCTEEPSRRLFRYDPGTNTWITRRMAPHVHRLGAAGIMGGKLYVAGGFNGSTAVTALDVYDPGANQWRTLAPLPQGGHAIGAVLKGKFHVLVGTNHYSYDPKTNRWKRLASTQYGHEALLKVDLNGRPHLLAVGGHHGPEVATPNPLELYTP